MFLHKLMNPPVPNNLVAGVWRRRGLPFTSAGALLLNPTADSIRRQAQPQGVEMTDTYLLLGNLLTFRARNSQTGTLSLVEVRTAPGAGAPPNRHPGDDEAFYVLSGEFEFMLAGTSRICGAGEYVAIPTGAIHGFKNTGDKIARLLILNWPGKQHEMFFSAAGQRLPPGTVEFPSPTDPADIARVIEIGLECGIEFPEAGT